MEPTRDAVVQVLKVIIIINMAPVVQLEQQQQVVRAGPWGGGGGGGSLSPPPPPPPPKNPIRVGYFGIPKNDKPRFTVANSPYSEGQPLLYGMHVPLKFTVFVL